MSHRGRVVSEGRLTQFAEFAFDSPRFECRDCGRTDEHTYCIRWMEQLYRWFGGKS